MTQELRIVGMDEKDLSSMLRQIIREELRELFPKAGLPRKEEYVMPAEICTEFKISRPTFYQWLRKGIFPIYKMGNRSFVLREEFLSALKKIQLNRIEKPVRKYNCKKEQSNNL